MTSSSLLYPFLLLAGCLTMEAFYSGSEIASYAVSRIRIRYWAEEKRPRMRLALFLLEHHPLVVITTLVGTNLSVYISGRAAFAVASRLIGGRVAAELTAALVLAPFVFLVAEVLPKWAFRRHADRVFPAGARILRLSMFVFYPFVRLLSGIAWLARRLVPGAAERGPLSATLERAFSRQGLREYVLTGAEVGAISREQYEVMETVMSGLSRPVAEFARPLAFLPTVEPHAAVKDAVREAVRRGRSAVLVAAEQTDVRGVVYLYDLVGTEGVALVDKYLRPADEVQADAPLRSVMERMRASGKGVCVVKDADGHVLGALFVETVVSAMMEARR